MNLKRNLKRLVAFLALMGALVCLPIYGYKIAKKTDYSDFDVYYRTAARVQAGSWNDIYNFEIDGNCPYRYAPPTLPIFLPMTALPLAQSRLVWFFLQAGFYAAGFYLLRQVVRQIRTQQGREDDSILIISGTFLFVLRFCLDSFTIGQVSGLMFLGFVISLGATLSRQPLRSALALLFPALCKVGPLIMLGPLLGFRVKEIRRLLLALIAVAFACWFVTFLWTGVWFHDLQRANFLWKGWARVLAGDSAFFDASHYGSQSIKSALLRFSKNGWFAPKIVQMLWLTIVGVGTALMSLFWFFRIPRSPRGVGLFFGLAVFGYLWFMPETFKYSQPFLAIPVAMLLSGSLSRFGKFAIVFGFAALSFAGLDIVGPALFFGIQKNSFPLLASLLLGVELIHQCILESEPRNGFS